MANRYTNQFPGLFEKYVKEIFLTVSFGASGAPTITRGKGVATVTRVSAGKYTITFGVASNSTAPLRKDNYAALLGFQHSFLNATAPAAPSSYIVANNVTAGSIQVQFNAAGTATDPASGEVALMRISLANSNIY